MNAVVTDRALLPFWRSVAHLLRFDLRRFRLFVAAIAGLEIARAAFVEWSLHLAPASADEGFGGAIGAEDALFGLVLVVATMFATAAIAQADRPSDDRAFWRTRPIAPLALATAKLTLFALLFVALPAAVNGVRLVAYGAPLPAVAAATVQIAAMAGVIVAPAWGLALATRTLPRFFAALAVLFVLLTVGVRMLAFWLMGGGGGAVGSVGFGFEMAGGGSALTLGLATALAFAILLLHYRLRRRLVALAAALVLIAAVVFLPDRRTAPDAPPVLRQIVDGRLRLPDGIGVPPSWSAQGAAGWPAFLSGRIELPPLPEKVSAAVLLRDTHVTVDGRRIAVRGVPQCCSGRGPIAAVAPAALAPAAPATPEPPIVFGLPAPLVPQILGRRIAVQSDADVTFARHVLVAAIPLRPGASYRTDRYLLEFLGYEPARRFVAIRFARFPRFADGETEGLSLFLADPARSRVIATTPAWRVAPTTAASGSYDWASGRTWSGRFQVLLTGIAAPPADAQLLIVETWPDGVAHTTLSVADVEVRAPRIE